MNGEVDCKKQIFLFSVQAVVDLRGHGPLFDPRLYACLLLVRLQLMSKSPSLWVSSSRINNINKEVACRKAGRTFSIGSGLQGAPPLVILSMKQKKHTPVSIFPTNVLNGGSGI